MVNLILHRIYGKHKLKKYINNELKRFYECTDILKNKNYKIDRADYQLAVAVHTIEKGLGYENIKKDFGVDKVQRICNLMEEYLNNGYPENRFGFMEAYSVLNAYIKYKKEVGEELFGIEEKFEKIKNRCKKAPQLIEKYKTGKRVYKKEELICENSQAIETFIKKCHSIRNYANKEVSEEDIIKSIKLANYAPSACNRQPIECYYTMDKVKINKIDKIIPGNVAIRGTTPNYIVVTSKMTHFSSHEFNQWYVNGGIYLAYLREALCVNNIGNCIYQWSTTADDIEMRKLLEIPESDVIVGIIGIGYYAEDSYCIYAQRKV